MHVGAGATAITELLQELREKQRYVKMVTCLFPIVLFQGMAMGKDLHL